MALSNLSGWNELAAPASACGAGDKPEEKPAACGSACPAVASEAHGDFYDADPQCWKEIE